MTGIINILILYYLFSIKLCILIIYIVFICISLYILSIHSHYTSSLCTIIIHTYTGVINIYNAIDLLEKTTYISIEEKQKNVTAKKTTAELLTRILPNGTTQCYKVIDNPRHLSQDEWDARVVAVFVSGQAWQFKVSLL